MSSAGITSSTLSIADLRAGLAGRVITPTDAGYDETRAVFGGGFDWKPAVIVRPTNATDVGRAIGAARASGLPFAIRNGGHSMYCSVDGGMVLDVRDLREIQVDLDRQTVWAGGGLSAAEYTHAVGQHGLATGFGDTGSVGISGITLGGGIGYLCRKHGLTIDSLLGAEIVTASGETLQISADSHPDLFWAIRGGGGNFGVVTKFHFQLHPVDQVVGGMMMLPATPDVVARVVEAAEAAPEELSAIINVMTAPPLPFIPEAARGKLVVMLLMCYAGDAEAGTRAVAPFRAIAQPLVDMVRPIKYPEIYPPDDPNYHPKAVSRSFFLDKVDGSVAEKIVEAVKNYDAPMRVVQLRVLGGAMARVPNDATAFAHRHSRIMGVVAAFFNGPEDRPAREGWTNTVMTSLQQGDKGVYVNFVNNEGEGRRRAAYPGATWDRLAQIKAKYDPQNFFRVNQNVPPAS